MIYLRRSGSRFTVGHGDLAHLEYVARRALDCGETVELQIDYGPWHPVTSYQEIDEKLHELYEELDARRDAIDLHQMPIEDLL